MSIDLPSLVIGFAVGVALTIFGLVFLILREIVHDNHDC